MPKGIQEWIHALEEGGGAKIVRVLVASLVFIAIALLYNLREYRNFTAPQAMDSAQLARNLAEGEGFTTDFVRPFSLHLLRKKSGQSDLPLDGPQPDISNAPLYPLALAQLMKATRPASEIPRLSEFDTEHPARLWKYEAEVHIGVLNQFLFFLSLVLLHSLARKLFDPLVAWVAVIAMGGAQLFWQFSVSGLPTMMLMVLMLALAHCLSLAEQGANEKKWGAGRLAALAGLAGILLGALALTQYAFAWLVLPTLAFFGYAFNQRRALLCIVALLGFAAVTAPWIKRNIDVSGEPLGTATFALNQDSLRFPGDRLERSLTPIKLDSPQDLNKVGVSEHWIKFWNNIGPTLSEDLPKYGGSWISAFFLVGLLMPFNRAGITRLRAFIVSALMLFVLVQTLTRSHASELTPTLNADNLLIAFAPLVFLFGAAMFSIVLDQASEEFSPRRRWLTGIFCGVICLPLLMAMLSPRKPTLTFPPYHPPLIHEASGWFERDEILMSDMPWAVAWYGDKPCFWMTLDPADDFAEIYNQKPIRGLYLSSLTMDRKLVSEQWEGEEYLWGRFAANSVVKGEMPDGFPLPHAFGEWFPFQLIMADRPRWEEARSQMLTEPEPRPTSVK